LLLYRQWRWHEAAHLWTRRAARRVGRCRAAAPDRRRHLLLLPSPTLPGLPRSAPPARRREPTAAADVRRDVHQPLEARLF
jgi:hypothetical protein